MKNRFILLSMLFVMNIFMTHKSFAQNNERIKHLIKFNLAPIFVGEFMPYYEYTFNKKISGEIGIGFVTDNYLQNFVQETNGSTTRIHKNGPAFTLAARYYPYRIAELIYCTAEVKYRRYRKAYQQFTTDGSTEENIEFNQRIIPRIGLGYHRFLDDHFLIDLSANLGLGFEKKLQTSYEVPISKYFLNFGIGFKLAYAL